MAIESEWTQGQFEFFNSQGIEYAVLSIDVGPNRTIDLGNVRVEAAGHD